jgi:tetratricopeptide (TPR) repeat protein
MRKLFLIILVGISSFSFAQIENIDSLKNMLDDVSGKEKIYVLHAITDYYEKLDPEKNLEYHEQILDLARDIEDIEQEVYALGSIGQIKLYLGEYYLAKEYFEKAMVLSQEANYNTGYINSLIALGLVYDYMCRYDSSLNYYIRALEHAEKNESNRGMSVALNNIGIIYARNHDIEKSLIYYLKALDLYSKIGDSTGVGFACANVALAYGRINKFDKSLKYFDRAIDIYKKDGNDKRLTAVLNSQGEVYMSIGEYLKAYTNFVKCLNYAKKIDDKEGIIIASKSLGNYFHMKDDNKTSLKYYNKGLEYAKTINAKEHIMDFYEGIGEIYYVNKDYENAVDNIILKEIYEDSIYNENTQKQLSELEIKYESEKKEKEILLLQAKSVINKKQKVILIGVAIALLIVGVLFIWLFVIKSTSLKRKTLLYEKEKQVAKLEVEKKELAAREAEAESHRLEEEMKANEEINYLKQEKYKEEIKHKYRELSTSTLLVVNKNGILSKIKEDLEKASGQSVGIINKTIKEIIKEIEGNINADNDWDTFKKHFEGVHAGFFERLIKTFPDITHNDLRLCAYMRINLNTKEIAQMLSISPTSVNQRRYRLRKKINLDTDTGLVEYMMNL